MKIYIATDSGLLIVSRTDGNWHCDLQLQGCAVQSVASDPLHPERLIAGTFGNGAWRSEDAGHYWRRVGNGIKHVKILSVAISRNDRIGDRAAIYVGTEPSMIFRSEDGGNSWQACDELATLPSASEWSFPPRPDAHHVRWIHPDPHSAGRLFAAIEAGALIRSEDCGRTWQDRVPSGPIDTHQLATHLSAPGRLYSAAGDGYFESLDSGETWQTLEEGLEHTYVWSIAVDSGDANNRIISTAASPRASHFKPDADSFLYRRKGHSKWRQLHNGLPHPSGRRTAVLAAHPSTAGTFFAMWESDLLRSIDGGDTWERLPVPWPSHAEIGEPRSLHVVD